MEVVGVLTVCNPVATVLEDDPFLPHGSQVEADVVFIATAASRTDALAAQEALNNMFGLQNETGAALPTDPNSEGSKPLWEDFYTSNFVVNGEQPCGRRVPHQEVASKKETVANVLHAMRQQRAVRVRRSSASHRYSGSVRRHRERCVLPSRVVHQGQCPGSAVVQ